MGCTPSKKQLTLIRNDILRGSKGYTHRRCRIEPYPTEDCSGRTPVAEENVPWQVKLPMYFPTEYTAPAVLWNPSWADPADIDVKKIPFNSLDGDIDRVSFVKVYARDKDGYPLNPRGRTGMRGRGLLGRYGPNHMAHAVVSRWQRDPISNEIVKGPTGHKILEFMAFRDTKSSSELWKIPHAFVLTGETVSSTLQGIFVTQAILNKTHTKQQMGSSEELTEADHADLHLKLDNLFHSGTELYKGYVDDPRNTDNAWVETVVINYHFAKEEDYGLFFLSAFDSEMKRNVSWLPVTQHIACDPTEVFFVRLMALRHNIRVNTSVSDLFG